MMLHVCIGSNFGAYILTTQVSGGIGIPKGFCKFVKYGVG